MPSRALTQTHLNDLKPRRSVRNLRDGALKGFGVRLLLLTGCRKSETATLEWSSADHGTARWLSVHRGDLRCAAHPRPASPARRFRPQRSRCRPVSSFRSASIRAARSKSLSRRRRMVARRSSRSSTRVRSLAISREASSWRRSCAPGCCRAWTVASAPTRAAAYRASASASASRASTSASSMSGIHPKRASDDTVRNSGTLDVRVSRATTQPALFIATPRTPRARMTRPGYSVPIPLRKHSTKAMS